MILQTIKIRIPANKEQQLVLGNPVMRKTLGRRGSRTKTRDPPVFSYNKKRHSTFKTPRESTCIEMKYNSPLQDNVVFIYIYAFGPT